VIGAISAAAIVRGAGRRGATLGGTAFLLLAAAVVVSLLALIPVVGYLEAVVLPVAAARRVRRGPEKYAGLRSLAK
jgi:1,6-anhydro-N-acetylmuramate kinase